MARPIVLIPHLFRLAGVIFFRKDYSPPLQSAISTLQSPLLLLFPWSQEQRLEVKYELSPLASILYPSLFSYISHLFLGDDAGPRHRSHHTAQADKLAPRSGHRFGVEVPYCHDICEELAYVSRRILLWSRS